MTQHTIHTNLDRWLTQMSVLERQIPFVRALTLTRLAQAARDDLREAVGTHFIERSAWTRRGITIVRATKVKPIAVVGSQADYMRLQVQGGTKRARRRTLAVPINARSTPRSKLPPSKWPGALLAKSRRYFISPLNPDDKNGTEGLWRLRGSVKNPTLELVYVLKKTTRVPRRYPWRAIVEQSVRNNLERIAREALARAMNTAKRS